MAEGKKDREQQAKEILADLESIFTGAPAPSPPVAPPAVPEPVAKAEPAALEPVVVPQPPAKVEAPAPEAEAAAPRPPIPAQPEAPAAPEPVAKAEPPPPAPAVPEPVAQAAPSSEEAQPVAAPRKEAQEIEIAGKKVPRDQVRRVGFFFSKGESKTFEQFLKFLEGIASTVSKKPLYLERAFLAEWTEGLDPASALQQAKSAGAVGVVCLFRDEDRDCVAADLEETFTRAGVLLRVVPVGDAQKRSTAVDVIVDLMLAPHA